MHSMRKTLGTLIVVLTCGAALAACSSSPSKKASGTTTTSTTSVSGVTTTTAASVATTTTTTVAGATTTTSGADQNLPVTDQVKSDLVAAYVAHGGLPAAQVGGTAPGSVYYAFRPATQTYWAIASFVPSASADMNTQVAMQDDGCCGIFTQASGGVWTFVATFEGGPCPGQIPADLETLWNLTPPGRCG
jgi:hypothetical protein